jgi:hypothetical protein
MLTRKSYFLNVLQAIMLLAYTIFEDSFLRIPLRKLIVRRSDLTIFAV